jgi:predicted secreted protein
MFSDSRSRKVILVAHCILNQNAKIDRCAHYPGAMREVTQKLLDAGIGIIQMPCPELCTLGLDRGVDKTAHTTIESEDDRVALLMNEAQALAFCEKAAADLVQQIGQYQRNGFQVLGILGINGSPTCGVEFRWANGVEEPGPGVLIRALAAECQKRNISMHMRGVKASQPEAGMIVINDLLV